VHVDTGGVAPFIQRVLIDLKSGASKETAVDRWDFERFNMWYYALSDRVLLGEEHNNKTNSTDFLVRSQLPDYKESKRVPFAEKRVPPPGTWETAISISGNRKAVVYTVDKRVIYRRTDDLEVVWEREIHTKKLLFRTAISFDGQLVAMCAGTGFVSVERNPDIYVFDGRDGTPSTHVTGTTLVNALAISPDHRLLAIAENLPPPKLKGNTQANVIVFDTNSGKELTRVVHDEFQPRSNPDHSIRADGLRFTSDGKYLVSSGLHTKVWEIT
jgi:hypothetical protein